MEESKLDRSFTVRVYGILNHPEKGVLLSHEYYKNQHFTKFPGGGVEWGEGPKEALQRELIEELNLNVPLNSIEHFYTIDFFQPSAFHPEQQVISIYYLVKVLEEKFTSVDEEGKVKALEWVLTSQLKEDHVTFPIERKVIRLLQKKLL